MPIATSDNYEVPGGPALPVYVVNLVLPASAAVAPGAATQTTLADVLAKIAAFGMTGLPSVDVLSIQGVVGGISVPTMPGSSTKATYMASITGLTPALLATDIFEIKGSASKTVKILGIHISGIATAAGAYDFLLIKRSTANTTGTSSAPTPVPLDSADGAATATLKAYTANPGALGTAVGTIASRKATVTTATGAIPEIPLVISFGIGQGKEVVLRGTSELLCLSLNGATMTGGSLNIDIVWTEE